MSDFNVTIPTGWEIKKADFGNNSHIIRRPNEIGGGAVTVDFDRRIFGAGSAPVTKAILRKSYHGKGWRSVMVNDAVIWLEKAMQW